jgi:hypothetical protein
MSKHVMPASLVAATEPVALRHVQIPDWSAVTLKIWPGDGGIQGDVRGPTKAWHNGVTFEISSSLPLLLAVSLAVDIANLHHVDIAVIDPNGLWDNRWVPLSPA